MAILHCLWIGGVTGLVASPFLRSRGALASAASSVAVGMLGALLGGLVASWVGARAEAIPYPPLTAAAVGAVLTLMAWSAGQRTMASSPARDKPSDGG